MYHHVNPNRGDMVTVTPETFEGQMSYLRKAGYRSLSLDELESYAAGTLPQKEKTVVITFDDAWLDNYVYAFPILVKYNLKATVFTVTGWVEGASRSRSREPKDKIPTHRKAKSLIKAGDFHRVIMDWEKIRTMMNTGLINFYSHTQTHPACHQLTGKRIMVELKGSRDTLEKILGRPCPYLCWPYGKYSESALNIAKDLGYRTIFTTRHGVVRPGITDPFEIPRIVVKDRIKWFKMRMLIYTNPFLSDMYLRLKKK